MLKENIETAIINYLFEESSSRYKLVQKGITLSKAIQNLLWRISYVHTERELFSGDVPGRLLAKSFREDCMIAEPSQEPKKNSFTPKQQKRKNIPRDKAPLKATIGDMMEAKKNGR